MDKLWNDILGKHTLNLTYNSLHFNTIYHSKNHRNLTVFIRIMTQVTDSKNILQLIQAV